MNKNSSLVIVDNTDPEQRKLEMVIKLASLFHEEWRAPLKRKDGSFEPRIKKTKYEAWIEKHGTDEVDIANASYAELPEDWQAENKAAAEVAMKEVLTAIKGGRKLDDAFIEEASSTVHDKWLERNGEWATEEQKRPFEELPEEEKEKDRAQIRKAIEIFEANK